MNSPLSDSQPSGSACAQPVTSATTKYHDFVCELAENIKTSVENAAWDTARIELVVLAEQIVSALIERRDPDIRTAYNLVERCHAMLSVKYDYDPAKIASPEPIMHMLGGMMYILAIALKHKKAI